MRQWAALPEGCVLGYLFLAFLAHQVHFYFFFEALNYLGFSNISWDIVPSLYGRVVKFLFGMLTYEPWDLEILTILCFTV